MWKRNWKKLDLVQWPAETRSPKAQARNEKLVTLFCLAVLVMVGIAL